MFCVDFDFFGASEFIFIEFGDFIFEAMEFSTEFSVLIDVLVVKVFHGEKVLEEGLKDVIFFVVGEFGETVGFEGVPFGEVGDFMFDVLEVIVDFEEFVLDFLFGRGEVLLDDLAVELDLGEIGLDEDVLHFGVVDFLKHGSVVSHSGDLFHGVFRVEVMGLGGYLG